MAGKYSAPKKRHWAPFVVILSVAALIATISGTMAWLTATSESELVNTFTPANVEVTVVETFENNVKTSIAVENTGDTDAYVRVTLISNWGKMIQNTDNEDEWIVCGDASHEHTDIVFSDDSLGDGWLKIGDYFYYTSPVKPGTSNATGNLLGTSITLSEIDDGCTQQVTVLAQAIQSDGVIEVDGVDVAAVTTVWPVGVNNGSLVFKE